MIPRILLFTLFAFAQLHLMASDVLRGTEANDKLSGTDLIRMKDHSPVPNFIRFITDQQPNQGKAIQIIQKMMVDHYFGLQLLNSKDDEFGYSHYRYIQTWKGVPIDLTQYIFHVKGGKVVMMNGDLTATVPNTAQAQITEASALQTALNEIGATQYKWEVEEDLVNDEHFKDFAFPKADLVIVPVEGKLTNAFRLAYKFNIYAHEPLSKNEVYVDAVTNEVIFRQNLIHDADATGTAVTGYSGTQTIVADSYGSGYRLRESGRGNGIQTFNMQEGTNYGGAVDFTDSDNYWNNANANLDEYATDAHWGAEMTYDYYLNEHNRNSIDGNGFMLRSYIHYDVNYGNAFWDGQRMTYGDGSGSTNPFTAIDITGHEISHGLTSYTANLVYQDESGALNESFSDIFGAAIEAYAHPNSWDWLIGEDIGTVIRSMSNPNSYGDPDTYGGTNYYIGTLDNGGVHINSGVQNKWFYILTEGENGTNDLGDSYNVTGIGISDAAAVAFRNLTVYLTSSSEYEDARFYAILSAIDLFGACSNEVEAVTNAWHAVGVGDPYANYVESDFLASETDFCTTPAQVNFDNLSSNGASFSWNFGDGSTSTDINPTHTYNNIGVYEVTLVVDGGACGTDSTNVTINIDPSIPCSVNMPESGTGPTQTYCSGTVYDPGGPNANYDDGIVSFLTIAPTGAIALDLTFIQFDVEAESSTCGYDYLEVYDGPNTNGTLLGRYCNTNTPPTTLNAPSGSATLLFYSDGSVNEAGFKIDWICTIPSIPPVSDFSSSTQETCTGEITFYDQSLYQPTSWAWDFGDGNTSTLQNPTHTYTQSGTYSVELTTTNQYGNDTETKTSFVTITKPTAPNVADQTVCINDDVTVSATSSGTLKWYDSPLGGNLLYTGDSVTIGTIQNDTTFYIEEVFASPSQYVGPADNTIGSGNIFNNYQYQIFDVFVDFKLVSVYVIAGSAGNRTIELRNASGTVLQDTVINIPSGGSRIDLNFEVTSGTNYQLGVSATSTINLYRNNSGAVYPYTLSGVCEITGSSASASGYYYFFYDWEVKEGDCTSERTKTVITVEDCETGIDELTGNSVRIYPNPFETEFTIQRSGNTTTTAYLTDVTGKLLNTFTLTESNATINMENYAAGIYFLNTGNQTFKLVKH
ncbi:MAG: hypothetical protein CL843_04580 [Crocinitomicaceae bacterium]|nr:hypothetical protein [Crocinitomicaceae bacterium]|tara:strand:- start:7644 stop:11084 length:3441 start_codon:yes stop_codon:yes gene_type:complete